MNKKHGYKHHPLYNTWCNIKDRCYNPNYQHYKDYGGRGIKVCDEWMNPKVFIEWALPLWKLWLQIDRIDNNGNYCPKNCRFVTNLENQHNKRLLTNRNTSGYCGVSYRKDLSKWQSRIYYQNKERHLGYFNSPKEAALSYNKAIIDSRPKNPL